MSQRLRLTALVAVLLIGAAAVLSAAQWVWEAADAAPQLHAGPAVAAQHGALRPVEGRPVELWGQTHRRPDRTVGDPTALAGGIGCVLLALALIGVPSGRGDRGLILRSAQERAPPLPLVL